MPATGSFTAFVAWCKVRFRKNNNGNHWTTRLR